MLSIRARGEICLWKKGRVAKFAFEKGSVAIREGGVAFRHAKMAWEKHYTWLEHMAPWLKLCSWVQNQGHNVNWKETLENTQETTFIAKSE